MQRASSHSSLNNSAPLPLTMRFHQFFLGLALCLNSALAAEQVLVDGDVCLDVEVVSVHTEGDLEGMTTYRMYATLPGPADVVITVFGDVEHPTSLQTTTSFYQSPLGGQFPCANNPILFDVYPDLAWDSWLTIGIDGPPVPELGEDCPQDVMSSQSTFMTDFENGSGFTIDDIIGSSWFVMPSNTNGIPDADGRVLLAQLTTDGVLSGVLHLQVLLGGIGTLAEIVELPLYGPCDTISPAVVLGCTDDGACNYDETANVDNEGCDFTSCAGCLDLTACNYDSDALIDSGDCQWFDECGECGGDNSTCTDECGIVNGPGPIYECGCNEILEGECDCEGTVPPLGYDCEGECLNDADNDGICDEFEVLGCVQSDACNYNADATEDDGSCTYPGDSCSDGSAMTSGDFIQPDCSCNGYGCIVETACNYEPEAVPDAELCDYESCFGCTDNGACNFDLTSTLDDGSCSYPGEPCDDGNALTLADVYQANCNCEGALVQGCANNQACNFNPIASIPDGSCLFPDDPCDDLNPLTFEDFIDENCYCGNYPVVSVTINAAPEWMVFPNPAKDVMTIEAKAYFEPYTLSVFDASLRLVYSGVGQGRSVLEISPFARGMYLIEVRTLVGTTRSRVLFD